MGIHIRTVGFTRLDWISRRFESLVDRPRTGAPRKISAVQLEKIVEAACAEPVGEALAQMARPPRNGAAVIADKSGHLRGIFTHGDFGRLVLQNPNTITQSIGTHMTSPCKFVLGGALVVDAQQLMHEMRVNALPVVDNDMLVLGLLDIQDLV